LIDFMVAHPILINRPIVQTPKGVRLCRPSEKVLDLLFNPTGRFVKEDGQVVGGVPKRPNIRQHMCVVVAGKNLKIYERSSSCRS
jgi:hypothetical protein